MSSRPIVLVTDHVVRSEAISILEESAEVKIISGGSAESTVINAVREVDAILARRVNISKKVIEAAPKLKIIARHGVGVEQVDIYEATRRGIYVTFTPTANSESVSEFTMALLLTFYREIIKGYQNVQKGGWYQAKLINNEIYQKKIGIIGLGNVGLRVAKKAKAFEMEILGYDPYISQETAKNFGIKLVSINNLLSESDVISLHVRHTKETEKMIGKKELGLMKKNAVLLNTSRGKVIDEEALINALENADIAGACLDTFWAEPLPLDSKLRTFDNVILTPHMAGSTKEAFIRMGTEAAKNIVKVLKGEIPINVYNKEIFHKDK